MGTGGVGGAKAGCRKRERIGSWGNMEKDGKRKENGGWGKKTIDSRQIAMGQGKPTPCFITEKKITKERMSPWKNPETRSTV